MWWNYSLYIKKLWELPKTSASCSEAGVFRSSAWLGGGSRNRMCFERFADVREAGEFGGFRSCLANRYSATAALPRRSACGESCCLLSPCSECSYCFSLFHGCSLFCSFRSRWKHEATPGCKICDVAWLCPQCEIVVFTSLRVWPTPFWFPQIWQRNACR